MVQCWRKWKGNQYDHFSTLIALYMFGLLEKKKNPSNHQPSLTSPCFPISQTCPYLSVKIHIKFLELFSILADSVLSSLCLPSFVDSRYHILVVIRHSQDCLVVSLIPILSKEATIVLVISASSTPGTMPSRGQICNKDLLNEWWIRCDEKGTGKNYPCYYELITRMEVCKKY